MRAASVLLLLLLSTSCTQSAGGAAVTLHDTLSPEPAFHQPYRVHAQVALHARVPDNALEDDIPASVESTDTHVASVSLTPISDTAGPGIDFSLSARSEGDATIRMKNRKGDVVAEQAIRVRAPDAMEVHSPVVRGFRRGADARLPEPLIARRNSDFTVELLWSREGERLWGAGVVDESLESACPVHVRRPRFDGGADLVVMRCDVDGELRVAMPWDAGFAMAINVEDRVDHLSVDLDEAPSGGFSAGVVHGFTAEGAEFADLDVTTQLALSTAGRLFRWKQGDAPEPAVIRHADVERVVVVRTFRQPNPDSASSSCQHAPVSGWMLALLVGNLAWRRRKR